MKYLTDSEIEQSDRSPLAQGETFTFRCHNQLDCFNRCCHNLNLFLYPYDVLRLKKALGISADEFIETYVDIILRPGEHFSEVLLRMVESPEKPCIFLSSQGCRVYEDRPHTCRLFPIEQGVYFNASRGRATAVYYFRPPDFCLGPNQSDTHTVDTYTKGQGARVYSEMTTRWAEIRRFMQNNPWGTDGPQGAKAKMAFMAAYNMDRFREFVFQSSFLKRYRVSKKVIHRVRKSDAELLSLGLDWIKLFLWGIPSKMIRS